MPELVIRVPQPLGLFIGSITLAVIVFRFFIFLDSFFANHTTKTELANRLKQKREISWSSMIIQIYERIFVGTKPTRSKRTKFWRSTCVSIVLALVLSIVFFLSSTPFQESFNEYLNEARTEFPTLPGFLILFVSLGGFFLGLNPVIDYCSLIETRLMLKWMNSTDRVTRIISLAILDLFLTCILVLSLFPALLLLVSCLGASCSEIYDMGVYVAFIGTLEIMYDALLLRGDMFFLGVCIYTTFSTSVWIWLYVSAETVFKLFPFFQTKFPIDDRPFQSIGAVIAILVGSGNFVVFAISSSFGA